jgi:hypothetical protein
MGPALAVPFSCCENSSLRLGFEQEVIFHESGETIQSTRYYLISVRDLQASGLHRGRPDGTKA